MKDKIAELLMFYGDQANELSDKIKELGLEDEALVIGGVCIFNEDEDSVAQGSNFYVNDEDELDFAMAMLKHAYNKKDTGYTDFLDMLSGDDEKE